MRNGKQCTLYFRKLLLFTKLSYRARNKKRKRPVHNEMDILTSNRQQPVVIVYCVSLGFAKYWMKWFTTSWNVSHLNFGGEEALSSFTLFDFATCWTRRLLTRLNPRIAVIIYTCSARGGVVTLWMSQVFSLNGWLLENQSVGLASQRSQILPPVVDIWKLPQLPTRSAGNQAVTVTIK